jgi:GNAT superfamily N-acetyltransferase
MTIEIRVFDSLPENINEVSRRLCREAFEFESEGEPSNPEGEQEVYEKYCSEADLIKQLLAFEDSEIIGGLELYKRSIAFDGRKILLGGFGAVWTRPDKRRKGVSTALLNRGMDVLRDHGCDIAFLCTDVTTLGGLYGAVGFQPLVTNHTYLGRFGKRHVDSDGMIAPVCSEELFGRILKSKEPFDIGRGNW